MSRYSALKSAKLFSVLAAAGGVIVGESGGAWLADPKLLIVAAIGLPIGILLRVGLLVQRNARSDLIKRDFLISLLIAAANFVLSVFIAARTHVSYLEALLISVVVAASGAQGLLLAAKWVRDRLIPIDARMGERRQDAQKQISASLIALKEMQDKESRDDEPHP